MSGTGDDPRLSRAVVLRVAYLAVQGGSSIVLLVALAYVLDSRAFAAVAVAQGTAVVAQAVADLGLSTGVASIVARRLHEGESEPGTVLLGAASRMFLVVSAGAVVVTAATALAFDGDVAVATLLIAPAAAAGVWVAGADAVLRAGGEFRRQVRIVVQARAVPLLAVAPAAWGSAAGTAAAIAGLSVAGAVPALVPLLRANRDATWSQTRRVLRDCLPLGGAQLLVVVSARLNTIVLGAVAPASAAGFEGAWRTYQVGQYLGGAVASAAAPLAGAGIGRGQRDVVRRLVSRSLAGLVPVGVVVGGGLYLGSDPLGELLFPAVADEAATGMKTLALVTPLALAGQVALAVLGAVDRERALVPVAFGVGAAVNVTFLALDPDITGAALGAAAAAGVTAAILLLRLVLLLRHWRT